MRRTIKCLVLGLVFLTVAWFLMAAVVKVNEAAGRVQCKNNLKQFGLAFESYHDACGRYPIATVPNPDLPPEKRLGWIVELSPFMVGGVLSLIDREKPWDASENYPPRCRIPKAEDGERERPFGQWRLFLCPLQPGQVDDTLPGLTSYVGIAGVGENAAELPLTSPRAGFFGHDRKVAQFDIKDGTSQTMAVAEVIDGGYWTAGGRATVRGLAQALPYLGQGGQFTSHHGRNPFPLSHRGGLNILLVDGSVRYLQASVSPQVVEALATIAGNEQVSLPDD